MEVTGINSSELNEPNNVPNSNSSVNALTGVTGLADILEKSLTTQESILKILQTGPSATIDVDKASLIRNEALNANTDALLKLTDTINSATLDISVNGFDSEFFSTLMKFVGKNSGKLTGLETFSKVFESAVIRMGSLDKYAKSIDRTSQSLMGVFGTFKEFGKGMAFFSAGLALLGFTILTFMEAITLDDILMFGATMLGIRLAIEIVTGDIGGRPGARGSTAWDMAKVAIGIATLGLAVWSFTEVVDWKMALMFSGTLAIIGGGIFLMNKIISYSSDQSINIIKGAAAIAIMSGSLWLMNKVIADFDPVDIVTALETGVITWGFAKVFQGMGSGMTQIIQGSIAAASVGAGLFVMSYGLREINSVNVSLERGLELAAVTVAAAGIFALIGNPVTVGFTLAGAAAAAAIGAALWVLSKGLNSISTVNVTPPQAQQFGQSILTTLDALLVLGNPSSLIALGIAVPASIAMGISTFALSKAVNIVGSMNIQSPEKYDNFKYGVERIVDAYTSLGGWSIAKAGVAAGVITLVSGASVLTAFAINAFSKISASPDAVNMAVASLDAFVTGVSTSFDKNKSKFDSITPGIQSFFGVASMVKEIAETVQAVSNLQFIDKEIVNGKVVIKSTRSFTEEDFANVGSSIGKMLNALTDPLAKIGSSQDTYSIGGFTVTNPFSNKVQEGIEAMASIGSVFNPITNIVRTFADKNVDTKFINAFNMNLASLLTGISKAFSQDNIEIDDDVVDNISNASKSLNSIILRITNPQFTKGVSQFKTFSKDLVSVKNSLNAIDLGKLTKFNSMLFELNQLQKSDSMKELVKAFKEFIETFIDYTNSHQQSNAAPVQQSNGFNPFDMNSQQKKQAQSFVEVAKSKDPESELRLMDFEELLKQSKMLYQYLSSGQLEVKLKTF